MPGHLRILGCVLLSALLVMVAASTALTEPEVIRRSDWDRVLDYVSTSYPSYEGPRPPTSARLVIEAPLDMWLEMRSLVEGWGAGDTVAVRCVENSSLHESAERVASGQADAALVGANPVRESSAGGQGSVGENVRQVPVFIERCALVVNEGFHRCTLSLDELRSALGDSRNGNGTVQPSFTIGVAWDILEAPQNYGFAELQMKRVELLQHREFVSRLLTDPAFVYITNRPGVLRGCKTLALRRGGTLQMISVWQGLEGVEDGGYPFERTWYLVYPVNGESEKAQSMREFVRFVLSKQGQRIALAFRLFPIPSKVAARHRAMVEPAMRRGGATWPAEP